MASSSKTFLSSVAQNVNGNWSNRYDIGIPSTNVVDINSGYTLDKFLDSYLSFIKTSNFVYEGNIEPKNHQFSIWLDTSSSQN